VARRVTLLRCGSAIWDGAASLLIGLLLIAVYIGPRHLLVLAHVVPVQGVDLLGVSAGSVTGCCRFRRAPRWEITPIERAS